MERSTTRHVHIAAIRRPPARLGHRCSHPYHGKSGSGGGAPKFCLVRRHVRQLVCAGQWKRDAVECTCQRKSYNDRLIQVRCLRHSHGFPGSSAILSLTGVNTQQSQIVSIRSMGNNWGENVTYNTRPTLGDVVAQGSMAGGATMTAQVPVNGNGTVSFAVTTADAGSTRNA